MSGISSASTAGTDSIERWAALDKQNERVVDATHPLFAELAEFTRGRPLVQENLPAAS
jgi:hypothetical protein